LREYRNPHRRRHTVAPTLRACILHRNCQHGQRAGALAMQAARSATRLFT
jgi:hypothetical protein